MDGLGRQLWPDGLQRGGQGRDGLQVSRKGHWQAISDESRCPSETVVV